MEVHPGRPAAGRGDAQRPRQPGPPEVLVMSSGGPERVGNYLFFQFFLQSNS